MPLQPGDPVRVVTTKWGGEPNWFFPAQWLGVDGHGTWVALPTGSVMTKPGRHEEAMTDMVTLVPAPGGLGGGAWLATFHGPGAELATYVDMTTVPTWDDPPDETSAGTATCRAVDLDLDVVRGADDRVWVDDEDEFAEHRVSLAYPPEVVTLAELSRDAVLDAVTRRSPPFAGEHRGWLAQVAALPRPVPPDPAAS